MRKTRQPSRSELLELVTAGEGLEVQVPEEALLREAMLELLKWEVRGRPGQGGRRGCAGLWGQGGEGWGGGGRGGMRICLKKSLNRYISSTSTESI